MTAWIVVNSKTGEIWGAINNYFVGNFYVKEETAEYIAMGNNRRFDCENWYVQQVTVST